MKHRPALPPEIRELMNLVRAGKLFAVQNWIADGKPVTPPKPYWFSPLRVAVETGFHSMIELLLQQGVEAEERDYMLNKAVENADFEVIKLLIEYGANIQSVDFEDVCRTGHPLIIQHFLDNGIDAETDLPFAKALRFPKRRFLGIYMRYKKGIPTFERQMNLALRYHAQQGNQKWVSLLMWAGGDPHLRLPEIDDEPDAKEDTSAIEEAAARNQLAIVDKIGIDPEQDNIDRMFEIACMLGRSEMIDKLLAVGAKINGKDDSGKPMKHAMFHLSSAMEERWGFRSEVGAKQAVALVVRLADIGARWNPSNCDLRRFRRLLSHFDGKFIEHVVGEFKNHQVFPLDSLAKLIKTERIKALLGWRWDQLIDKVKGKTRNR